MEILWQFFSAYGRRQRVASLRTVAMKGFQKISTNQREIK